MSEVAPKTERGVPRQLLDRELGKLIDAMGGAIDADAVLFEEAFSLKPYCLFPFSERHDRPELLQ